MQFMVLAYDGTDDGATARRMAAREAHLATIADYKQRGHMILGAALQNAEGQMNGSVLVVDFPTREALDQWLESDPYVTGGVWQTISVTPCAVAPSFKHLLPSA